LFDGGFILSFTVVAAIVVLAPPIARRLESLVATDPLLPRQLRPRWRRWIDRPLAYTVRLLSCSLAAWIGFAALAGQLFPSVHTVERCGEPDSPAAAQRGDRARVGGDPDPRLWSWLALTFNNANFFVCRR